MNKICAVAINTFWNFFSWKKLLLLAIPFSFLVLSSMGLQVIYRNQDVKQIYFFAEFIQEAVFFIAGLLPVIKLFSDFRQNRLQTILTKPIRNWYFLAGIFLGCQLFLFGLILTMDLFLQLVLIIKGSGVDQRLNFIMLFTFFACMPLTGFSLFLTILINPVAAGIVIFLFRPGFFESIVELVEYSRIATIFKVPISFLLNIMIYVFPQMSELLLQDNFFVYRIIEPYRLAWGLLYAFDYSIAAILVATFFFKKKDLIKGG